MLSLKGIQSKRIILPTNQNRTKDFFTYDKSPETFGAFVQIKTT
jgi:hypothetical protein